MSFFSDVIFTGMLTKTLQVNQVDDRLTAGLHNILNLFPTRAAIGSVHLPLTCADTTLSCTGDPLALSISNIAVDLRRLHPFVHAEINTMQNVWELALLDLPFLTSDTLANMSHVTVQMSTGPAVPTWHTLHDELEALACALVDMSVVKFAC